MARVAVQNNQINLTLSTTGLFKRVGKELMQAVFVDFSEEPDPGWMVELRIGRRYEQKPISEIGCFNGHLMLFIPEVSVDTPFEVSVVTGDGRSAVANAVAKPEKHWTIFILHHTHFDLGYTDRQDKVWELQRKTLDDVITYCRETDDFPTGSTFKYIIEATSLLRDWQQNRSQAEFEEMLKLIREGRVELLAWHSNLLTELCGHEELVRGLYLGGEFAERYGITIRSAISSSHPSSASVPDTG